MNDFHVHADGRLPQFPRRACFDHDPEVRIGEHPVAPSLLPGAETRAPRRPRFGQLTYTAFDSTGSAGAMGSGGWQVKQQSAELTAEERDILLQEVRTEMPLEGPVSAFPSTAEILALPRRLAYRKAPIGGLFSHTTPAGSDATGRPDNVFSHVLIDRALASAAGPDGAQARVPLRPIELWGASQWLTPFGAREVQQAQFAEDEAPRPSGVVSRQTVAHFLFDPAMYRFGVMGLVLDAVAGALAGGPALVLGASSAEEGAMWVGVASFLTAPSVAARISFSTFERLESVLARPPALISVVPARDLSTVRPGTAAGVVLVDLQEEVSTHDGEHGEFWQNRFGQRVPVTDWSRLALDVCGSTADVLAHCLVAVDRIAGQMAPRGDIDCAWPLAAAVAGDDLFATARATAARVALAVGDVELPGHLRSSLVALLRETISGSVEQAWRLVEEPPPAGPPASSLLDSAVLGYLELALDSDDWLGQPGGAPIPGHVPPRSAASRLSPAVARVVDRWLTPEYDAAVVLRLRALDFVCRLEAAGYPLADQHTRVTDLAERCGSLLCGASGAEVARQVQRLAPGTLTGVLWPVIGGRLQPAHGFPGERLAPDVIELLGAGLPDELVADRALAAVQVADQRSPAGAQVAVEVLVHRVVADPAAHVDLRVRAAALLLRRGVGWRQALTAQGRMREALRRVGGDRIWSLPELEELLDLLGPDADSGAARELGLARQLRDEALIPVEGGPGCALAGRLAELSGLPQVERDLLRVYARLTPDWYLDDLGRATRHAKVFYGIREIWPDLPDLPGDVRRAVAPLAVVAGVAVALAGGGVVRTEPRLHPPARQASRRMQGSGRGHLSRGVLPGEFDRQVLDLGARQARPLIVTMLRQSSGRPLRDALTQACMWPIITGRPAVPDMFNVKLSPDLAAELQAPDLARAALRAMFADFGGRRAAEEYLKSQERALLAKPGVRKPDNIVKDRLSAWRNDVLPDEDAPDPGRAPARGWLRGRLRR